MSTCSRTSVINKPAKRYILWLIPAALIAGCAPEPEPYDTVADVQQLMLTVVAPAAEVYWDSVGTIMTLAGTEEIAPKTFQEWEAVRNAAMTVAESGNLLLMPGRIQEDQLWTELSLAMIASGRVALAAAQVRDAEAVFEAGGELYTVCNDCHAVFAPEALNSGFKLDN